jgi:DNA polymerase I-like protein with 3'-5' exonuclease and polymerase domains
MELNGVKLDVDKWKALINNAETKKKEAEKELMEILREGKGEEQHTLFGDIHSINLNSSSQLLTAFKKIGININDTSNKTLQKNIDKDAIKWLLEYRKYEKLITSFGENMLKLVNKVTGRVHPDFNQFGADTGRFSCQNPNVQQIPHSQDFRECFIAEKGNKLITADYSQAELRILAQLSNDPKFIEAFCSGEDLHKLTASQMFNVPLDKVEKSMRSAAKTINFGLAYGRGASSLAGQLGVDPKEAKKLIDQYFAAYSGVKDWLEKAAKDAFELGYSLTPYGRKRFYEKPRHNDKDYSSKKASIERQGKNTPIQGANADITKIALVFLYESLKQYNAKLVNTVHDEIVVEASEEVAEQVQHLLEQEMQRAGAEVVKSVPMKVDGQIADYWTK